VTNCNAKVVLVASDVSKLNPSPDKKDIDSATLVSAGPLINSTMRHTLKSPTHLEAITAQPDISEKKLLIIISISAGIFIFLFHYFSFLK